MKLLTKLLFTFFSFLATSINAQQKPKTLQSMRGEYYLTGVMETACGFKLNADSTFQFYFSQGALDRYGTGKWSMKDGMLLLNTPHIPGKDFKLLKSTKTDSDSLTVKIIDSNSMLFNYMDCLVVTDKKEYPQSTDQDGIAVFPVKSADSILLQFRFCPEKISAFAIQDKTTNYFEFGIEKWLTDFSLKTLH